MNFLGRMMSQAILQLNKREDRRLRAGHLWVFSNEVNVKKTPLHNFAPGQTVSVVAHDGSFLGTGYVNPNSLICARLISRNANEKLNRALLLQRLKTALAFREAFFQKPFYRWCYGESDGLPGLIIDRYGDVIVAQITTAGMENIKDEIIATIETIVQPKALLLRNDSPIRSMEGLIYMSKQPQASYLNWLLCKKMKCYFRWL